MLNQDKQQLIECLAQATQAALAASEPAADAAHINVPAVLLDRPKVAEHGDFSCNIAMQVAKAARRNPRELAQAIAAHMLQQPAAMALLQPNGVEIAGPGFINLRVANSAKRKVLHAALTQGANYGRGNSGAGQQVMVEFVSANPTGPLHVGHARQAALGDALSNLFAFEGWQVHREFYYNDAGNQIHNLAISVQARAQGVLPDDPQFPADGYRGEYIQDIAQDFLAGKTVSAADGQPVTASGDVQDLENIRRFAVAYLRHEQDMDLRSFNLQFDHYFLESSVYADGGVEKTVQALVAGGHTFEDGGALWLRTTELGQGDDKDRVMRKSDGTYTYFVPDVAYHITKFKRGFTKVVNVQGSDHHGTVARVRSGLQALNMGIPQGFPDYILHKMVKVVRGGQEVKLSKRAGDYVTMHDLIEWVGRDAVRFFLISRKADTEFTFDIDVALNQSDENPVYYVQYAHARICKILRDWGGDVATLAQVDLSPLDSPAAMLMTQRLAQFGDVCAQAVQDVAPHLIAFYLKDTAAQFHSYYNAERVLVEDEAVKLARLALLAATAQVIRNGLGLLGVSSPEKM